MSTESKLDRCAISICKLYLLHMTPNYDTIVCLSITLKTFVFKMIPVWRLFRNNIKRSSNHDCLRSFR